jgi:hypothetical protein
MRSILTTTACVLVFAGLCLAETFNGKLIDASCASQQQATAACAPNSSTTAFALEVSGKVYKLDDTGNSKAAEALKNQANRESNPDSAAAKSAVAARVKGTLEGDIIKVDTIEVR